MLLIKKQNMKEHLLKTNKIIIALLILFIGCQAQNSTCGRQRCCSLSPCTSLYCQQKSSETWISTQNYDNYQFTKLVLSNNQCKPCSYNCKVCSSQSTCTTCYDGFYLNTTTFICSPCDYKCIKCQVINSLSKCSQCDAGSYLDTTSLSCKLCPVGAKSCADQTSIIQCNPGYLKSSNSLFCTPCPSNCISCPTSTTTCSVCDTGYYVSSGLCKKCNVTNCDTCVQVGASVFCTQCSLGYFKLSSTVCSSCPLNCKTCTNATVCTTCKSGYYIQGGGCSAVQNLISNCQTYSNTTVNGTNKCTLCITGYYLASTGLQCIPCSITCNSCYGDHFGRCTACVNTTKLFNQMCIPVPYVTSTQLQLYYTAAANSITFTGGNLMCSNLLYSGSTISLNLNNLASYKLVVSFRLFTEIPGQQYNISLNSTTNTSSLNSTNNTYNSSAFTSSSLGYQICMNSNNSASYYAHIYNTTFSSVKLQNTLKFTSVSSTLKLYISQILIVAYKCSSLCLQCSQSQCFTCVTQNLYKQDAYCVYVCGNGYYTYEQQKQCVKQCPLGTYSLLTNISCVPCVSPCVTCLNDKYCLTCVQGYFLSTLTHTCQTSCPYRYYGSAKTQKCQQCVGRCNQCINDQQCLTCQTGFLENSTCVDNCAVGYYQNISSLKCQLCSSICLTCEYKIDNCLSCPLGKYFYNNTCLSSCPLGFYINSNFSTCQSCLYPCENCVNSSSLCLSCVDGYLLNNICYPQCPDTYYADNVLLVCLKCSPFCTKCIASPTNCISCVTGYKLFSTLCLQNCPNKYYSELVSNTSILICSKCVGVCQTCVNQTFCLTCNANFLTSNNSGQCVRSSLCMSNQFGNINTLKCQPCSASCYTCYYNSSFCTSCFVGSILFNNTCLGSCPNQYFYPLTKIANNITNYSQSVCTLCEQPCLTCINQTQCLSCVQGYKYSSNTNICSSTCSIGSYFNITINDCQSCSTDCLNCNNNQFCNICKLNTYLYVLSSTQNSCVGSCPSGFYADGLSCMACLYPCLLCTSSIDCINCQNGVLYQKRCISGCPQSTFMNIINNTCENCQGNCLTCKNSSTQCTSCKSGYFIIISSFTCVTTCPNATYPFDISKSCLSCPETCSACLNNSYCTGCIIGKTFLNSATHTCIQYCAAGYFGNNVSGTCEACLSKCQTCTKTSSQCLTCSNNYLLTRLQNATYDCVSSCPTRYFNESGICYHCVFPCQQCESASLCKTCASGTYYHNQSKSCLLSCPLGTYYATAPTFQCISCTSPCKTCKDSTKCISCISNYTLYDATCVQECPPKFYADGSGICNKCYGYCQTCSGKYYCLTCQTGFAYSGFCYSTCPPGTYASLKIKACVKCQQPCLECTGIATYCKKCQPGLFVYRGQCSSNCPIGTHKSGQMCSTCKFPCIKCQSQFNCQQCLGGYLLYMNVSCILNIQKCPNDLYKLNFKQCVPSTWCPSNYYRDEQLKTCSLSCSPQKYFNRRSLTCVNSCNEGQYVGKNMQCINWTKQLPTSLMAMQPIVFIQSSQIHVVLVFNQTVQWLAKGQNLYSVHGSQTGRRRLLSSQQGYIFINYTLQSPQQLVFQIKQMPYSVEIHLPAHYLQSSETGYNLQTPTITVRLPTYITYGYEQVYIGSIMKQFSEGISWFIILFSFFFLFMNRLSDAYILWDTAQLLFLLIFLNIQYPPNLNQFLLGMSNINFLFVPSLFSSIVSDKRLVSSSPFYAYTHDNSFLRTAGSPLLIAIVAFVIFIVLKLMELLIKHSEKIKQKMEKYPRIKNYIFKGLLRFRWHHTSDVFFLSYDIIMLFAVAQIKNISKNPNNIISNVICFVVLIIYIIFPCFVSYKLSKHYKNIAKGKMVTNLQCFYRGIQKTNKFGISLILIRYFRKLMYCVIIGIFTNQPMFALPILMFTSVLLALFIFINKPFKKKLSNVITVLTQVCLAVIYLFIALIQFGQTTLSVSVKVILGWISCGLLLVVLFALIFQIFCKTMFYLQSEKVQKQGGDNKNKKITEEQNELTKNFTEQYIRQKAGQFFDQYFPKLKSDFGMDDSSQMLNEYEDGDSENSENNQLRQKDWGINSQSESKRSDQFRHYGEDSETGTDPKTFGNKRTQKKAPSYLIRCVKELN